MATPFAPLKIRIAYLNSPIPKATSYIQKCIDILYRTEISAILAYFFLKFGCHGNSLCSLENSDSILEFADPENHILHAKSVSIACSELKSVQGWLFLPTLVAMATALASLKIQIAYVYLPNPVTLLFTRKILDILYRTKISAILAHFCPNLVAMVTPVSYTHLTLPTIYSV